MNYNIRIAILFMDYNNRIAIHLNKMLEPCFQLSRTFLKVKRRPYRRFLLQRKPFQGQLSILTGQRGVGKTTVMIQHMLDTTDDPASTSILYVPSDHFSIEGLHLYDIAESFYQQGGQLLCIDEIHSYRGWSKELKSINDTFKDLKVIASGSSLLKLSEGTHDLSRRAIVHNLPGLSLREYLELETGLGFEAQSLEELLSRHETIASKIVDKLGNFRILQLFKAYLRHGYYPYYREFNEDEASFFLTLEQGAHASIRNDMASLYPSMSGNSLKKNEQLLSAIARSTPFQPDLKKLKQSLDIGDERTLKEYLLRLEEAGLIKTLPRAGTPMGSLFKPEKIYLDNTNQIHAFGSGGELQGNLRETFFLNATSIDHRVTSAKLGDFKIGQYLFEVGGKNKSFDQIKDIADSYLVLDDLEIGYKNKIPIWLFGFLT